MRVSCSVIGDGPGTGGRGPDGGRDKGGLRLHEIGVVERGVVGMCEGGTGKEESKRGTSFRLSMERDSVVVEVVAMARRVAKADNHKRGGGSSQPASQTGWRWSPGVMKWMNMGVSLKDGRKPRGRWSVSE